MKGTRLGNYEVLDKLGEGGMGEVWRARDERLNRFVAVKILPRDVSGDPGRGARFEREARSLGALNHPNIVAVYDTGTESGRAYIVSELVDGESLRTIIDRGRIAPRKLIEYAVQIAEAMAAAHAVGIVHRDLKPENIMVTPTGRVKVLDFGLAKQTSATPVENTATLALSQPGTVMGTVGYMAPEQVRGEATDHRSDIFSFGAVLYEMISGKRAFQARSSVETMNAILHEEPPELDAAVRLHPAALDIIVRHCLEKRPEDRFQSAADLAFALRAVTPGSSTGTQVAVRRPALRSRKWLWFAVALPASLALFYAGFLVRDRTLRSEPPRFQRITFRTGLVTNARFTPDGRNVIFSAKWDDGPSRVYLARPGNPDSRDLGLPDGTTLLAVSSNQEIASLNGPFSPAGTGTLSRSSISGGQMRPALEDVATADWGADGSSLAVLRLAAGGFRLEYPIGKVLLGAYEQAPMAIRVSPDGDRVALVHYYQGSSIGLTVVDRSGKRQFVGVVSDQSPNRIDPMLSWNPNGREIWFRSFDPKEWGTIYAMNLKGRRRLLARVPGHVTLYDIARDGRLLLRTDTRQVGILSMVPGDREERNLSCLDAGNLVGISSDGGVIAATVLGESGGPKGSVYLRKTDGSAPIRLGDGGAFQLSPDGKFVSAYSSTDPGTRRFVLLPTGAGEEREIAIPQLKNMNMVFGWLPGGESFLVHGPGTDKSWRDYVWSPRSGALRPIETKDVGDAVPRVSPDGRQILTVAADRSWRVYPVDGGEGREVAGLTGHNIPIGWRADNRSLFIVTHHDENRTIPVSVLDIDTGKITPWKEIRPQRPVEQVLNPQKTPDGRAYAYNYIVKTTELYVADGVK